MGKLDPGRTLCEFWASQVPPLPFEHPCCEAQCTHPDSCLHDKGAELLWAYPAAPGVQLQGKH